MNLYLIQHAQSRSKEEDPERGITQQGRDSVLKAAHYFKTLNPQIHEIWHSSKLRARQTAHILADTLGITDKIKEQTNLAPNDNVQDAIKMLLRVEGNIAVVGHLPHLSRLASKLITGNEQVELIHFQNAGIICLMKKEESWRISWIIIPGVLQV